MKAKKIEHLISERTRDLHSSNSLLARSNKELEQFAYAASHDLQEPLRKINAFGDILKQKYKDVLSEDGSELVERMQRASDRMKVLIDELLSFSQVTTTPEEKELTNLNLVISEVMLDLDTLVQEKHANISVDSMYPINGHCVQLRQLFQNLISNSIKFSKEGVDPIINITSKIIQGEEAATTDTRVNPAVTYQLIQVSDNGIGFEQQYAERIFQMFQRLHGRIDYAGSGIGLSIVARVVENHDGYITATSTPGEGATFSILLPL